MSQTEDTTTDTFLITVDDARPNTEESSRLARNQIEDMVSSFLRKTVEVQTNMVAEEVSQIYTKVLRVLDSLPSDESAYVVREMSFSIIVDSEGKASLLSAVSGGVKTGVGLTFVISKKE